MTGWSYDNCKALLKNVLRVKIILKILINLSNFRYFKLLQKIHPLVKSSKAKTRNHRDVQLEGDKQEIKFRLEEWHNTGTDLIHSLKHSAALTLGKELSDLLFSNLINNLWLCCCFNCSLLCVFISVVE